MNITEKNHRDFVCLCDCREAFTTVRKFVIIFWDLYNYKKSPIFWRTRNDVIVRSCLNIQLLWHLVNIMPSFVFSFSLND